VRLVNGHCVLRLGKGVANGGWGLTVVRISEPLLVTPESLVIGELPSIAI
jgi:hypothetical protein